MMIEYLDMDLMLDSLMGLAKSLGRELDDYDSDADQEECLNNLLRDASAALNKHNIIFDKDTGQFTQDNYIPIPKQQLLDAGINVFGIDLVAESFLRLSDTPDDLSIFFPVNRSDCADYSGLNIRLEPVRKS